MGDRILFVYRHSNTFLRLLLSIVGCTFSGSALKTLHVSHSMSQVSSQECFSLIHSPVQFSLFLLCLIVPSLVLSSLHNPSKSQINIQFWSIRVLHLQQCTALYPLASNSLAVTPPRLPADVCAHPRLLAASGASSSRSVH